MRKNCSAWQARAPAHRACVRVDGPETALFDCNDIGRSGVQACRAPLCSSSPCAIQLANGGCPVGREYGTAAPKAKLTAAPPPVDRTCARHRTSLRCGCHFHLVPRGSTLSARPLHGPLPRHHTQLRRSREMSDELRCCVRTRVGGCSRCMACALQLANISPFWDRALRTLWGFGTHGYDYIIHAAPRARPACCRRALGGRWWNSPPYRSCSAVIQPPGTTVGGSRPPDRA